MGEKHSGHKRARDNWYVEDPWVTEKLVRVLNLPPTWHYHDPFCGCGTIPETLRSLGYNASGADIRPRAPGYEVLDYMHDPRQHDALVFNPPYGGDYTVKLIERAICHARYLVAAFVRDKFPYSEGRYDFFTHRHPPAAIVHCSRRANCPPGEMLLSGKIKRGGGSTDYSWFVWKPGHLGPAHTYWII